MIYVNQARSLIWPTFQSSNAPGPVLAIPRKRISFQSHRRLLVAI
jgi:hypothetical protein